jgi:hypothetical protein
MQISANDHPDEPEAEAIVRQRKRKRHWHNRTRTRIGANPIGNKQLWRLDGSEAWYATSLQRRLPMR